MSPPDRGGTRRRFFSPVLVTPCLVAIPGAARAGLAKGSSDQGSSAHVIA
jgi:hypothetical protein